MKYVLLVGDGMADLPIAELQNMTVLEYTHCPMLDKLASAVEIGSVQTVPISMAPGTDTAFYGLMGYDPREYYTGMAPLEAHGMGIRLADGEIAIRCNLVNISDDSFDIAVMGSHSCYNVDNEVGRVIVDWLIHEPEFKSELDALSMTIVPCYGFRHLAILKHSERYNIEEDFAIVPPHDITGKQIRNYINPQTNNNRLMWRLIRKSSEILPRCPYNQELVRMGYRPCNCIWLWGAGTKPDFVSIRERFGVSGAVIAGVPIVNGICSLCGMTPIRVEGATGYKNTNYQGKALSAVDALLNKGFDFVLVHVEAPDECSHEGDIDGKIMAVKNIDKMAETIVKGLGEEEFRIMVMSDHISSLESRTHDWGSVPYLLFDSRTFRERGISFDESSSKKFGGEVKNVTALLSRLFETE